GEGVVEAVRGGGGRSGVWGVWWVVRAGVIRAQQATESAPTGKQIEQNTTDVESVAPAGSRYDEVTVTATPLRSLSDLATPTDVLSGQQLQQQMQSTLGQTLDQQPGVSSTYYGPNPSRPTIPGQAADPTPILPNATRT